MAERSIPERLVQSAIAQPTKVLHDDTGKLLIKKLYRKGDKERLLLVVGELTRDVLKVITIIDTSKVDKYI